MTKEKLDVRTNCALQSEKKEMKMLPLIEEIKVSRVYATSVYALLRAQNTNFNDFEEYFEGVLEYLKEPESASLHLYRKDKLIHSCTIRTRGDNMLADMDFDFRQYEGMERKQKALVAPQVVAIEGKDMHFILIDKNRMMIYNTTVGDYKPKEEISLPLDTGKQMIILPLYTKNTYAEPRKLGVWTINGKDLMLLNSTLTGDDAITETMLLFSTLSSGVSRIVERFDPLTKLPTRVAMEEQLRSAVSLYNSGRIEDFSLILLDVDDFKQINDIYGHAVGDLVLKTISQEIFYSSRKKRVVRNGEMQNQFPDFLARWGGEEFLQLVHGNIKAGIECAKRLRKIIEKININLAIGGALKITCTYGIASARSVFGNEKKQLDFDDVMELINAADKKLYKGKNSGKNCICAEGEEPIRE